MSRFRLKGISENTYTTTKTQVGIPDTVQEMDDYTSLSDTDSRFFSKTGSDSNNGLKATPKLTAQACIDIAVTDSKTYVACIDTEPQIYKEKIDLKGKTLVCVNYAYPTFKPNKTQTVEGNLSKTINTIFHDTKVSTPLITASTTDGVWTQEKQGDTWSQISATSGKNIKLSIRGVVGGVEHLYYLEKSTDDVWVDGTHSTDRPTTDEPLYAIIFNNKLYVYSNGNFETYDGNTWTMESLRGGFQLSDDSFYEMDGYAINRVKNNVIDSYTPGNRVSILLYATSSEIYFLDFTNDFYIYNFDSQILTYIDNAEYLFYGKVGGLWFKLIDEAGTSTGYVWLDNLWQSLGAVNFIAEVVRKAEFNSGDATAIYHDVARKIPNEILLITATNYTRLRAAIINSSVSGGTIYGSKIDGLNFSQGVKNAHIYFSNIINTIIAGANRDNSIEYDWENNILDGGIVGMLSETFSGYGNLSCVNNIIKTFDVAFLQGNTDPANTSIFNSIFVNNKEVIRTMTARLNYITCNDTIFVNNNWIATNYLNGFQFSNCLIDSDLVLDILNEYQSTYINCYSASPLWDNDLRLKAVGFGDPVTSPYFSGEKWDGTEGQSLGAYADDTQTIDTTIIPFDIELLSSPDTANIQIAPTHYKKSFSESGEMYQNASENSEALTLSWSANVASVDWNEQYFLLKNIIENYEVLKLGKSNGSGGWEPAINLSAITGTDENYTATFSDKVRKNEFANYWIEINSIYYRIVSHGAGTSSVDLVLKSGGTFSADTGTVDYRLMKIDKGQSYTVNPRIDVGAEVKTGYKLTFYLIKEGGDSIE